ncbi:hypothetical protein CK934_11720 [Chitinophaga sp. MD30]|nr:hypothetical protein CK934_11720 [Chitinophaga sp. MD30]
MLASGGLYGVGLAGIASLLQYNKFGRSLHDKHYPDRVGRGGAGIKKALPGVGRAFKYFYT